MFLVNQDLRTANGATKRSDNGNNLQVASWEIRNNGRKSPPKPRHPQKQPGLVQLPLRLRESFCPVNAYRQRVFDNFLRSWVPLDHYGPNMWLRLVVTLPYHSPSLVNALQAVAIGNISFDHKDDYLHTQSLRYYTQALQELQKAIGDPDDKLTDETLATCLLLGIYELIICPAKGKFGYASHQDGCARLMELRGPEAHQVGLGHSLFVAVRSLYTMRSMQHHATMFLTEPDWMQVPWATAPKTESDRLWDCLARAPAIFKRADGFDTWTPLEKLCNALEMIDDCWQIDAELESLYMHLEYSFPGPLYWPELSIMEDDDDDGEIGRLFPVAFHFSHLRIAMIMTMYWATLCMSWHGIGLLYGVVADCSVEGKDVVALQSRSDMLRKGLRTCDADCPCKTDSTLFCSSKFDMAKLPPLAHRTDFAAPGKNVCQAVEYCMQPEMLVSGPSSILAPLGIVVGTLQTYDRYRREVAWGNAIFKKIEKERYPFLKYIREDDKK